MPPELGWIWRGNGMVTAWRDRHVTCGMVSMVVVWIWVNDRVMENEDLGGGRKGLFLQLGFRVEVANPDEDGGESRG